MESSSMNGMCRCCASQGAFKDIKSSYNWMGEEEVYSDMLRECFDVNLTSVEQGGICELCITQLRNASNFKKQVQLTEQQFKEHLRSKGFKPAVKEEVSAFDDNDSDDNDMDNGDDEDYVPEYDVPIKTESESEEKPGKKRGAKAVSTRAKKSKSSDGDAVKSFLSNIANAELKKEVETNWGLTIKKIKTEEDTIDLTDTVEDDIAPQITRLNFKLKANRPSKKKRRESKLKKNVESKIKILDLKITNISKKEEKIKKSVTKKEVTNKTKQNPAPKTPVSVALTAAPDSEALELKRSIELDKHRFNIRTILNFSNATPIRTHYSGYGYACCFCKKFFPKASELKTHTINEHDKKQKSKFMARVFLGSFAVKLDITGLCCNICKDEFTVLDDLTKHLNDNHNKHINMDVKSQIICFKLDNEELKCIFCQKEFTSFKILLEHMNQHYRNFICEVCDAGFVSQRMLWFHAEGHKEGEYKCEVCEKIFDKMRSLKYHMRMSHTQLQRYRCYQCDEKFAKIRSKKAHMTEVHGVKFERLPCLACDRTFIDKNALRIHTKRDHLMERRFQCPDCDKSFYTNSLLRNHSVIHTGTREFKCELCGRDFARKKTLHTHMRTHRDDAKFVCQICQKVFYTRSNLEAHVATHPSPTEFYTCTECAITFYELSALQNHIMTEHGDMPV